MILSKPTDNLSTVLRTTISVLKEIPTKTLLELLPYYCAFLHGSYLFHDHEK